jgi:hypothetical protein
VTEQEKLADEAKLQAMGAGIARDLLSALDRLEGNFTLYQPIFASVASMSECLAAAAALLRTRKAQPIVGAQEVLERVSALQAKVTIAKARTP